MAVDQKELGEILRNGLAEQQGLMNAENAEIDQTPVETEEAVDEVEKPEETVAEAETEEGQEQEEQETQTAEEETEGVEINDLSQLATAIEVEPEFLYNLKIPMSDGMEPISLSELKDGYTQFKRGATADLETLEKERADFETYRQQTEQQIQTMAMLPKEILEAQAAAMAIANYYQSYDWDAFEKENPGQAALEKQKLSASYQQAVGKHQDMLQKYQHQQATEFKKNADLEFKKMLKSIPEWNDPKVKAQDQDEMRLVLREYGYSDQEIDSLSDHRAMRLARDVTKLRQQGQKAMKTIKKVSKLPKRVKAGVVPKPSVSNQKLQKSIDRAKKTKDIGVKTRAIGDILRSRST